MRRWKVGWDWPAQKWCYPHPKFVVVLFRNCHATHPRVPSPPIRGRRWPTGRMRGHSGTAAYEKIPLTLPSPPNRLRRCCVIALVAATQTIWGRGDIFGPSGRHKSEIKKISPNPTLLRSPGWDQRANASAGPPIEALLMVGRRGLAAACPTLQNHYTTPYEL
jgi:hypothetical protein